MRKILANVVIYCGDEPIAYSNDEKTVKLLTNDLKKIPITLFSIGDSECSYEKYQKWLETRVFPENRIDKQELLEKMKLPFRDINKILKLTNGVMVGDNFWIDWDKEIEIE